MTRLRPCALSAVFICILVSLLSSTYSQSVPLQGTIIRALTWSANEGGYQRQKTFYQAFDIASGQVIGTGQWILPTLAAQPLPIMWLPDHKLLAFGAANGREAPYMWYGMDPRTGNVTATFPIDSYPQPQYLYGGSDATVRNGLLSDVAPYQMGNSPFDKRGVFFSTIKIGEDKFMVRQLQDRKPLSFNSWVWSVTNPVANVLVWSTNFVGGVIDLNTGETVMNLTQSFSKPLGVSNEPGQTATTVKFVTSWYLKDAGESCYGFFSIANVSDYQTSWCNGGMTKGYYSLLTYSEDHHGLFFSYAKVYNDKEPKLYFLPMQWAVRTEPILVPGNITVPAIPYWSSPSTSRTIITTVKFVEL